MKHYVYTHCKATNGEVFYVGKGKENRAFDFSSRNRHHKFVAAKHGVVVKIVKEFTTEKEALDFEVALIAELGLENLTNVTAGGEGTTGYRHTEETKRAMSARLTKNNPSHLPHVKELRRKQLLADNPVHKLDRSGKNNPMYGVRLTGADNGAAKAVKNLDTGKVFATGKEAASFYSTDPSSLLRVCKGRQKTAGGYRWAYAN